MPDPEDVWGKAELVLKVKEPIAVEYDRMREGQTLFTYLHLAANRDCTRALLDAHVIGIARDSPAAQRLPTLAGTDERGSRSACAAGRRLSPDAAGRWPGR